MNIFVSKIESPVFSFSSKEMLPGFELIGDFSGEWGDLIPDQVLAIMSAHNPGIVKYKNSDDITLAESGVIIGYDFTTV